MTDGPIFRSPDDIAEAIATQKTTETRVDAIIRRESELGVFELEAVREAYKGAI